MSVTIVGKIARELCEQFPKTSTHALARMLHERHPLVFETFDRARDAVRHYRGQRKNSAGKYKSDPVPFKSPKSYTKPWSPVNFSGRGNGLVISDVHMEYHDERALDLAINWAIQRNFTDFLLINGDFIDAHRISKFETDPRRRRFSEEVEAAKSLLTVFKSLFKRVVYKEGNHEARFEAYMRHKAPELLGVEKFTLRSIMDLDEIGIEHVHHSQIIYAGRLTILHGHEYGKGLTNPVSPARGMSLKARSCTLSGHLHKTTTQNDPTIRGELISCWSTGCLCELHPEYATLNGWDHGFAEMSFDGDSFDVSALRIINGKVRHT